MKDLYSESGWFKVLRPEQDCEWSMPSHGREAKKQHDHLVIKCDL